MRILHTIPGRNWGGMEHRVLEQMRWLVRNGVEAWLAAPEDGESYKKAKVEGLPVVAMCFDPPTRAVPALRRFVKQHRIQVIDTHVTRDAKAAGWCLDLCAVVRSRHVNQYLKPGLIRSLQWKLLSDHVITVAECTRADLVRDGLIDAGRSVSIGGWADERFFELPDPVATRVRLRAELGIASEATLVVCVGMIRPDKGQNFLIEALSRLDRHAPAVAFVGSATAECAEYEAGIKALAAEKLPGRAFWTGYRDDVSELMQMADLVVIPSLTEAQPRVAVQAFAVGKPVIASAVGGVPEIVVEGKTGWLVPPADPDALCAAIAKVLDDPAAAAAMAAGARALAQGSMRFDHRMEQTLATYRIAMERARTRPFIRARGLT